MSENHLVTELENGSVVITDSVFRTIANIATEKVSGVNSLTGGLTGDFVEIFSKKSHTKGVKVENVDGELIIDISVVVNFGTDIQKVAGKIQQDVKTEVETMTGFTVKAVNIEIASVRQQKKKEKADE